MNMNQLLQVIVLLIAFIIPILFDATAIIQMLFYGENLNFETVQYYFLSKMGNKAIGLVFMLLSYLNSFTQVIRKKS